MKKLSIILFLCAMISTSFAQLTLLHTFDGNVQAQGEYITEPINRYIYRNNNTIQIYKPDFSLEKTVSISLPAGYEITLITTTQHFFNSDNKYEFFISAHQTEAAASDQYSYAVIINDEGTVIHNFGYSYMFSGSCHRIAGQLRFVLLKYIYTGTSTINYNTEVYSCGGNYSGVAPIESHNQLSPYPNPATSIINLPYELAQGTTAEMRIFNSNGQVVEVKQLGSHFNNILLNVDNYVPGIYFYEYNGNRGKFIVQ